MDRIRITDEELDALYGALIGREPFRYRAEEDPLYRSYAERYIHNGRMAMMDSTARAASLTGGYGSSYAQSVGQQQYDEYLRALSEAVPELYGRAWEQYQAQGQAMKDAYQLGLQRWEADYARDRDAMEDQRRADESAYQRQKENYRQLYQLILSTGYSPGDSELDAAGMSRERAEALRQSWQAKQRPESTRYIYVSGGKKNNEEKQTVVKPSQQNQPVQPVKTGGGGGGRNLDALR